ncbi:hypothetical protein [Helicobacter sp.]|uniref:hypothetical protein n=1 Tax=Helicobacter sp. TaxID=218 RepID=UPI0025B7C616|nr:hypothetical protein [Helicobacter sp.]MBR2494503.1 hypothetical protein [Helicobacter sp.]
MAEFVQESNESFLARIPASQRRATTQATLFIKQQRSIECGVLSYLLVGDLSY